MMNEKLSNPDPLGLMAFGMNTVLLGFLIPSPLAAGLPLKTGSRACPEV
jgi:succinate-acetate transporter protein